MKYLILIAALALAACNDPPHVATPGPVDECVGKQPNGLPCP